MKITMFAMSSSYLATERKVVSQISYDKDLFTLCNIPINESRPWSSFYTVVKNKVYEN